MSADFVNFVIIIKYAPPTIVPTNNLAKLPSTQKLHEKITIAIEMEYNSEGAISFNCIKIP